jgi:arginine-tRNA-protein transferase
MVEDTTVRTHLVEYRAPSENGGPGALCACALVDTLVDGLSLVYSFFDPAFARQSPGSFVILDHLNQASAQKLPHLYLGYWVRGARKMDYKARFSPLEILDPAGWRPFAPGDRLDG